MTMTTVLRGWARAQADLPHCCQFGCGICLPFKDQSTSDLGTGGHKRLLACGHVQQARAQLAVGPAKLLECESPQAEYQPPQAL